MTTERVTVELDVYAPESLAHPTDRVRWWLVDDGRYVRVEGTAEDVAAFYRAHWGDEAADEYFTPDALVEAYAVKDGRCDHWLQIDDEAGYCTRPRGHDGIHTLRTRASNPPYELAD